MLQGALEALARAIWPDRCPACDAFVVERGLCPHCADSLYPLGTACPRCAEPQSSPIALVCARCTRRPPPFAAAHAPWRFGGELATAIRRWKYGGAGDSGRAELTRALVPHLAPALAAAAAACGATVIVPVPASRARLRSRGFSQVCRLLAATPTPCPVAAAILARTRDAPAQAGLSLAARRANVRGAFAARASVRTARVLLVDDVMTSGSTFAAATRALLTAGAAHVEVLALARAES